jgi:hypothetical protein
MLLNKALTIEKGLRGKKPKDYITITLIINAFNNKKFKPWIINKL